MVALLRDSCMGGGGGGGEREGVSDLKRMAAPTSWEKASSGRRKVAQPKLR